MSDTKVCTIRELPQELWIPAAEKAIEINPANASAANLLRLASPDVVIAPERLAVVTARRWNKNGVELTVGFLDSTPDDLKARILSHMNAWGLRANVRFSLAGTATTAQVRINRTGGDSYWSYLGTDILSIAAGDPTMNLEGFTMDTVDSEFYRVIRHETGHTLGFPHEHQRAEIVNRIDPEKAIAYFNKEYGWPRDKVIDAVLTSLDNSALNVTAQPDVNSIMSYWLPAEIMKDNIAVDGGKDIDEQDAEFAASVYPLGS